MTERFQGKQPYRRIAAAAGLTLLPALYGWAYFPPPLKTIPRPTAVRAAVRWLPLAALQNRCRFRVDAPGTLPGGYRLSEARLVWVVRDAAYPKLPSRQAICLAYADTAGHSLWVIQARHLPRGEPHENVNQALFRGYFLAALPAHCQLAYGSRRGVDSVVLASGLSLPALHRIEAAF